MYSIFSRIDSKKISPLFMVFFSQGFHVNMTFFSLFPYFIIVSLIIIQIISPRQVSMVSVLCSTLPRTINKSSQARVPYDPMITKDLL